MSYHLKSVYGNYHIDLGIVTNKEGIDMLLNNSAIKELRRADFAVLYKLKKVDDRYYLEITNVRFSYLQDNGVFDVLDAIPYRETMLIGEGYADIKQTFKRPMSMTVYNDPLNNDPPAYLCCQRTIEPRYDCTRIDEDIDTVAETDKQNPNSVQQPKPDKQKSELYTGHIGNPVSTDMTAVLERIDKLERAVNKLQVQVNELDGRVRRIGGIVGTSSATRRIYPCS